MSDKKKIVRALISVSDKTGITEFARTLASLGIEILSTGGTAKELRGAGLTIIDVSDYTGSPELFDGRVKTLHPKVHGGLLHRRDSEDHLKQAKDNNIPPIDLVVVNLYPFEQTVAKEDVSFDEAIENIDIGGPSMLRSAAKNHDSVTVVVDPKDYSRVLKELCDNDGCTTPELRRELALKVFIRTCQYDGAISSYLSGGKFNIITGMEVCDCKAENGSQGLARLVSVGTDDQLALENFKLEQGSAPSVNNWTDINRLVQYMAHIAATWEANYGNIPKIAVAVKHGNACGAAISDSAKSAVYKAIQGDSLAVFGGLIMLNFPVTDAIAITMADAMDNGKALFDGVIAPWFSKGAIDTLSRSKGRCRMMVNPALEYDLGLDKANQFRSVRGGFLIQPAYQFTLVFDHPEMEVYGERNNEHEANLLLGFAVGCRSNSNTITLVRDGMVIGNGVCQQSRVGASKLSVTRAIDAGHGIVNGWLNCVRSYFGITVSKPLEGAVAYGDSFFSHPDAVQVLINAGVKAIFSTSGSKIGDEAVRALCSKYGVTLYQLPDSIARGFFH